MHMPALAVCNHAVTPADRQLRQRQVLLLLQRQPLLQVAQRWRFASNPQALRKQGEPQVLPAARVSDLAAALAARSYQIFLQDGQLYAFKGLAGRLGPIGVHIALLMCLAGTAYSGFGGWKGAAMCPEGQEFVVGQAISPASSLASYPGSADTVLQVGAAYYSVITLLCYTLCDIVMLHCYYTLLLHCCWYHHHRALLFSPVPDRVSH